MFRSANRLVHLRANSRLESSYRVRMLNDVTVVDFRFLRDPQEIVRHRGCFSTRVCVVRFQKLLEHEMTQKKCPGVMSPSEEVKHRPVVGIRGFDPV